MFQMVKKKKICLKCRRPVLNSWMGKIPWEGNGHPLQYSFLENSMGQRSLVSYSSRSQKESGMTEWLTFSLWASQVALVVKNLTANVGDCMRHRFDPWAGEIPWRKAWQPPPVFLPGDSHGQRPGGLQSTGSQSRSWLKWQHRTARCKNLNLIINVLDNLGLAHDQLLQLCPTLCNPMDCSSTGFSAPRILQARRLEWVAMPSSRGSSWPRYWTHVLANGFFTTSDTWEAQVRII